jgi:hypothetical protein
MNFIKKIISFFTRKKKYYNPYFEYEKITDDKDILRAMCNHRYTDGSDGLYFRPESKIVKCAICGAKFYAIDTSSNKNSKL